MTRLHNKKLKLFAASNRNNMTKEERHLWYDFLQPLPVHFCRQKILGKYILDFYCAAAKLGIELDGSQHFEDAGLAYDKDREEFFKSLGVRIVRYSNADVNLRFENVCNDILNILGLYV